MIRRVGLALLAVGSIALLLELSLVTAGRFSSVGSILLSDPSRAKTGEAFLYDPTLGWRNLPGSITQTYGHPVHINSKGLRGREYPYAKGDGHFRILVLSDSFGWGFAVGDDQVFSEVLEKRMGEASGVEVLNASVSGWGPDQQYLYLADEGARYEPDVVVFTIFALNDYEDVRSSHQYGLEKPVLWFAADGGFEVRNVPVPLVPASSNAAIRSNRWNLVRPRSSLFGSALYRSVLAISLSRPWLRSSLATAGLVAAEQRDKAALPEILEGQTLPAIDLRPHTLAHLAEVQPQMVPARQLLRRERRAAKPFEASLEPHVDHMVRIVAETQRRCDQIGARLVVMTHGAFMFWDPPLVVELQKRLADGIRGLRGVQHFDLDAALRAKGIEPPALHAGGVDSHWGPTGHRLVATLLQTELRRSGLLPE